MGCIFNFGVVLPLNYTRFYPRGEGRTLISLSLSWPLINNHIPTKLQVGLYGLRTTLIINTCSASTPITTSPYITSQIFNILCNQDSINQSVYPFRYATSIIIVNILENMVNVLIFLTNNICYFLNFYVGN